jgi:hypothetical protein
VLGHVELDLVGEAMELALEERDHLALSGDPPRPQVGGFSARPAALLIHALLQRTGFVA